MLQNLFREIGHSGFKFHIQLVVGEGQVEADFNWKQSKGRMKSILVVFVLQLLLHLHLGRKHYLVEVADSPSSDNPPPTGNGELSNNGNDYHVIGEHERCEGLRKLCNKRPSCPEAIKCGNGGKTATHVSGDEDEEYQEVGHKQHREYKPAHFEHKKNNGGL